LTGAGPVINIGAMRIPASFLVLSLCGLMFGCGTLRGASPAARIGDTVHDMNDQARWGRLGDASQYVEVGYRGTYLTNHRYWGSKIQLADVEVEQVQISTDAELATAFVTYSWYGTDAMTLHQSVVRQRWSANKERYTLMSEAVVQGDPTLLGGELGAGNMDSASVSAFGPN
jgi:hypothetical protein